MEQYVETIVETDIEDLRVLVSDIDPDTKGADGPVRDHLVRDDATLCHWLDEGAAERAHEDERLALQRGTEYFQMGESENLPPANADHSLCSSCWEFSKIIYPEITNQ